MSPYESYEQPDSGLNTPPAEQWNPRRPEYQAFRRFAELTRQSRELERQIKNLKRQKDALETQLADFLGAGGYQRVRVEDFSIFLRRSPYVAARDRASREEICAVLKSSGLGQFVHEDYAVKKLSAHVRELEEEYASELAAGEIGSVSQLLPPEVARVLHVDAVYHVVALESPRK